MSSSIADEITRLSGCRDDILSAISSMGVTVPVGSVLSSCPSLIQSIPTGGGGGNTLYNTAFTATSTASATGAYTATQIPVSATDNVTASPTGMDSSFAQWAPSYFLQTFDWSDVSSLDSLVVNIPMNYDVGNYTAFIGTGTSFSNAMDTSRVTNGYLAVKMGNYDLGVSTTVDSLYWYEIRNYYPSTIYVGFGSYSMQQEYTGVMDNYFTGKVTTGTAYPYPDRPVTDYFSATANATAYEQIVINSTIYSTGYLAYTHGSATNGTKTIGITTNGIGGSISALQPALSNVLGTGMFDNYPASAYTFTSYTGGVTSGSTGLGLQP